MTEAERRDVFEKLLAQEAYACAWGYCRRLCAQSGGSLDDAEDLMQDALVHAWRGLSGLRDQSRFKGWLLAIVRRRHFTRLARWKSEREADGAEAVEALASAASSSDVVAGPHSHELLAALRQLPEPAREALALFYLHGLSLAECGTVLGIAPRAVAMRLSRGRKLLRQQLAAHLQTTAEPAPRRTT